MFNKIIFFNTINNKQFAIMQILVGIFLILIRKFALKFIVVGLGVALFAIALSIMKEAKDSLNWYLFILPIILFMISIGFIFSPGKILSTVAFFIGIVVILKGLANLFFQEEYNKSMHSKIKNTMSIIFGIAIIFLSNNISAIFILFLAADLIISGFMDLYATKKYI